MRARVGRLPWSLVPLVLACGCQAEQTEPTGVVGVFYGGQVQRLEVVELGVDNPPRFGFRISWPQKRGEAQTARSVEWKLVRPGPQGRRVTRHGELEVPADQSRLDYVFPLTPDSELGSYNVRVTSAGRLLVDRAVDMRRASR